MTIHEHCMLRHMREYCLISCNVICGVMLLLEAVNATIQNNHDAAYCSCA